MTASRLRPSDVRRALAGIEPSAIPIACAKRLTLRHQLDCDLYRIGRIPPWRAFVAKLGGLNLIYVDPSYRNYRRVARKMHDRVIWGVDYDHALGRALAGAQGIRYVLLLRLDSRVNRSHGRWERPVARSGICLRKIFHFDRRILAKCLSRTGGALGDICPGYDPASRVEHRFTGRELTAFGEAIGLANVKADLGFLQPISK